MKTLQFADANDFANYDQIKVLSDTANDDEIQDKIDLADKEDIVQYNDKKDFVIQVSHDDEQRKELHETKKIYIIIRFWYRISR